MMDLVVPRGDGNLTSTDAGWPKVSQQSYEAVLITFLPLTILAVTSHLIIKHRHHQTCQSNRHHQRLYQYLDVSSVLLLLALSCSTAAWVLAWSMRNSIYDQMALMLGRQTQTPAADLEAVVAYIKWWKASMVLNWTAIYAAKLAFVVCVRTLVTRVRKLEVYWWGVVAVLVTNGVFSAGFGFWVCPWFSTVYLSNCPADPMTFREETYIYTTTGLDIFTGLLVISLPIMLLLKVTISLNRKLVLGIALCLSIFTVVICIVRATTYKLSNGIIDTTWLALWQYIETNMAILLISLTAFRSLYRQDASQDYIIPPRPSKLSSLSSFWPPLSCRLRRLSGKISRSGGVEEEREPKLQIDYDLLPERPRRAVPYIKRGATEEEIDSQFLSSLEFVSGISDSTMTSQRDPPPWPTWNHGKL